MFYYGSGSQKFQVCGPKLTSARLVSSRSSREESVHLTSTIWSPHGFLSCWPFSSNSPISCFSSHISYFLPSSCLPLRTLVIKFKTHQDRKIQDNLQSQDNLTQSSLQVLFTIKTMYSQALGIRRWLFFVGHYLAYRRSILESSL